MRIQAVLIDAENVSCTLAPSIMAEAKKQGMTTRPYVYGRKEALKGWQGAISTFSMQVRTHEGGKNAADRLLLQDAHALFEQQGVRDIYVVSNDGGFAPHISILRVAGCQVTV
ncbi:MAG TPA: NYN domain-containing protein, partial [Ktedonobacteraceae bacterium]|nr:NYN domain-containing protein [Ktedonobacteraceae bacterium]